MTIIFPKQLQSQVKNGQNHDISFKVSSTKDRTHYYYFGKETAAHGDDWLEEEAEGFLKQRGESQIEEEKKMSNKWTKRNKTLHGK